MAERRRGEHERKEKGEKRREGGDNKCGRRWGGKSDLYEKRKTPKRDGDEMRGDAFEQRRRHLSSQWTRGLIWNRRQIIRLTQDARWWENGLSLKDGELYTLQCYEHLAPQEKKEKKNKHPSPHLTQKNETEPAAPVMQGRAVRLNWGEEQTEKRIWKYTREKHTHTHTHNYRV